MFRKKDDTKETVTILPVYPKKLFREMSSEMEKHEFKFSRHEFAGECVVGIDSISVTFNTESRKGILYKMDKSVTSEYLSGWKKGLGRFILQDYKNRKTNDNLRKKYFILEFKNFITLIRAILEDEMQGDDGEDELKKYNLLNLDITSLYNKMTMEKNKKVLACVLKVERNYSGYVNMDWISRINPIDKNKMAETLETISKEIIDNRNSTNLNTAACGSSTSSDNVKINTNPLF